VCLAPEVL
jgi:hypothetical protein